MCAVPLLFSKSVHAELWMNTVPHEMIDVNVVLDVEAAELSRCVGMPRPACPASRFEACTEAIAADPCTGAASQACLDWSDFCPIEED